MQGPTPAQAPVRGEQSAAATRAADRVYQTVTIAAILLLLGSLWLF